MLERLASISYPLGDVALLAIAVRLAVGGGRRPVGFWLLAGSIVPLLVADALYGYLNLTGSWHEHNLVDVGWIVFYVGWGAAALHPSMRELTMPSASQRRTGSSPARVRRQRGARPAGRALRRSRRSARCIDGAAIAVVRCAELRARDGPHRRARRRGRRGAQRSPLPGPDRQRVRRHPRRRCRRASCSYHTPSTERVLGREPGGARRPTARRPARPRRRRTALLSCSRRSRVDHASSGTCIAVTANRATLEVIAADMRGDRGRRRSRAHDARHHRAEAASTPSSVSQALHDTLTGLPNRALFLDRVGHALSRARRHAGRGRGALPGPRRLQAGERQPRPRRGDELLIAVAARLTDARSSPGDTVARFGGDEFALLVEDADDAADMELVGAPRPGRAAGAVPVGGEDAYRPGQHRDRRRRARHPRSPTTCSVTPTSRCTSPSATARPATRCSTPTMHEDARDGSRSPPSCAAPSATAELVRLLPTDRRRRAPAHARGRGARSVAASASAGLLLPDEFIPIAESNGADRPARAVGARRSRAAGTAMASRLASSTTRSTSRVNLSARHLQDRRRGRARRRRAARLTAGGPSSRSPRPSVSEEREPPWCRHRISATASTVAGSFGSTIHPCTFSG